MCVEVEGSGVPFLERSSSNLDGGGEVEWIQ